MGVYRSRNNTHSWRIDTPDMKELDFEDREQLEIAWLQWRKVEMAKRLAWCLFEYDNSLSTLTTKTGVTSLQELPDTLPCDESLWEAHSARAWASMTYLTKNTIQGTRFRPLLRELLNGRIPPSDKAPSWWKRCCAQAIARLLWDLREMDHSICDLFATDSFWKSQKLRRKSLLQILSLLHDAAYRPCRPDELVHMKYVSTSTVRCVQS